MAIVSDWSRYAPYFTKAEFDCSHTGKNGMRVEFMDALYRLRVGYDKPMKITSGFRDITHPVEARKTHSNGEHTKGMCADVACVTSSDRYELVRLAYEFGFTRIGIAKNFIHLGLGAPGLPPKVVWLY
jgi:hypothetical protein